MNIVLTIVLVLFSFSFAHAQSDSRERARMAEAYERSGDVRSAARIYQELYEAQPSNEIYYRGVVRTLIALGQEQSLRPIVEQRLQRQPDVRTSALAARLAWKTGDTVRAEELWLRALQLGNGSADVHDMIAIDQRELGLYSRAITSLKRSRAIVGADDTHARELAALYTVVGDVRHAMEEILKHYKRVRDVNNVRGLISALMTTEESTTIVRSVLDAQSEDETIFLPIRQWFARETKDWETALRLTITLDDARNVRGQDILAFADGARADGRYDIALRAYDRVRNHPHASQGAVLSAAYGTARTLEARFRAGERPDPDEAVTIIELYRTIVREHPNSGLSAEALLQTARLQLDPLGDRVSAVETLQRLVNGFRGTTPAAEGQLLQARIFLGNRQFDPAIAAVSDLSRMHQTHVADQRDKAELLLADIFLVTGRRDTAAVLYQQLASNPGSVAANDALERNLLLTFAMDDSAGVAQFLKGFAANLTNNPKEAARAFQEAATIARDRELKDRCLLEAAESFLKLGNDSEAEPLLRPLTERAPECIFGDRAYWLLADIAVRRRNVPMAIQHLSNLLVNYPRSILVSDARERIRRLRGDA